MAKQKEMSSADKCRRTKLSKKSVEELVSIILRKDDVERKNTKTIENYKKVVALDEKRFANLKDSLAKSEEIQLLQDKSINSYKKSVELLKSSINDKDETINDISTRLHNAESTIDELRKINANDINLIRKIKSHLYLTYGVIAILILVVIYTFSH